jgi:hypothetical protein
MDGAYRTLPDTGTAMKLCTVPSEYVPCKYVPAISRAVTSQQNRRDTILFIGPGRVSLIVWPVRNPTEQIRHFRTSGTPYGEW